MPKNISKNEKSDYLANKSDKSPFNSKLFLDIGIDTSNDTETDESKSNDSFDSEELESKNNNDYFLLNDLLKELDLSYSEKISNPKKNNYIASNLNNNNNYCLNNNNICYPYINGMLEYIYLINLINSQRINGDTEKKLYEKKGDWICRFCQNLNFSFRTQCNRCKACKSEAIKREIN